METEVRQTRNVLMEALIDEGYFGFAGFINNETTLTPTVAFKDFAKYYRLSFREANKITTSPDGKEKLKEKVYTGWLEDMVRSLDLEWEDHWEVMEPIMDYVYKWNKTPYNSSVAASGVIMTEYQPDLPVRNGAIAGNSHAMEDNGYIKYDLLSIDTLNQIQHFQDEVDWNSVDDPEVWKNIYNGETDFVFQFSSPGMKDLLIGAKVDTIEKLAECNGLYRPGPMELGMIKQYKDAANGHLEMDNEGTMLSLAMKEMYGKDHSGLIIFQEEVMKLCQEGSNFSLLEADHLRRALGKKIESLLQSFKPKFLEEFKYREYYDFGPEIGNLLPWAEVELSDGVKMEAKDAYEIIMSGQDLDIVSW